VRDLQSSTPADPPSNHADHTSSEPGTPFAIQWALGDKPLTVELSSTTLDQIRDSVLSSRKAQPQFCPGGLLLGTCDHHLQQWRLRVQDHAPLEWDARRGGAPFLTEAQSRALETKLAEYSGEVRALGFYRCSDPAARGEALTSDRLKSARRSFLEADRSLLLLGSQFQVVSMMLQLEWPDLEPHGNVLWEDSNVYELTLSTRGSSSYPRLPALARFETKSLERRSPLIPEPEQSNSNFTMPPSPAGPLRQKMYSHPVIWFMATILISILTYIGAHFLVKPFIVKVAGRIHAEETSTKPETTTPHIALGLEAKQSGAGLEVWWDPASSPIKQASSGKLTITDGTLTRDLVLSRGQLQGDRIVYTPQDGDVTFRLEVMDADSHAVAESVRILRSVPQREPVDNRVASHASRSHSALRGRKSSRGSTDELAIKPETSVVIVSNPQSAPSTSSAPGTVEFPSSSVQGNTRPVQAPEPPSVNTSLPLMVSPSRPPLLLPGSLRYRADTNTQRQRTAPQ